MTHINAYFAAVSEAEVKVAEAEAELAGAKQRLRDKKQELGLLEKPKEEKPADATTEDQADEDEK